MLKKITVFGYELLCQLFSTP